ncbi:MAG: 50S ribosomal protein L18Ae [Desulfurococcaceae archaeon]
MTSEVKIYKITGYMLISHNRLPTRQRFTLEIRALNEKDAVEKVYSILGSRHKLKRSHIDIVDIKIISPEEITRSELLRLIETTRIVK